MDFSVQTPAILFPAISLLLLAYTNRFLAISALIRSLHERYHERPEDKLLSQIKNLRMRVRLIRDMQILGILSIFLCTFSMLLVLFGFGQGARFVFFISLFTMLCSLFLSLREIVVSTEALAIELSDIMAEEYRYTLFNLRRKKQPDEEPQKTDDMPPNLP